MFFLVRLLFNLFGEVQHTLVERDRERHSKLPHWRPETRQEAEEAAEDEESLEEAEAYERSRQWKKALAIYRELVKYSPVPAIVVKAKMGIRRVKREQGH